MPQRYQRGRCFGFTRNRVVRSDGSWSKYWVSCFVNQTAYAQDQEAVTASDGDEEAVAKLKVVNHARARCPKLSTDKPAEETARRTCWAEHTVNLPISSPRHRCHGIRLICTPSAARTSASRAPSGSRRAVGHVPLAHLSAVFPSWSTPFHFAGDSASPAPTPARMMPTREK